MIDDNTVFNTGETQKELREKYNPDESKLRKLQMRMLDMLLYLDEVCKEQNIEWRLDGGNILGAVRHGGFIPWDDDIDIVLLPKEFKKLVAFLKCHDHPQFKLQDNDTDPGFYATNWVVLRDTKSEYKQSGYLHNARKYRGAQIDIFCYDNHMNRFLYRILSRISFFNIQKCIGRHSKIAQLIYILETKCLIPFAKVIGYPFSSSNAYGHAYGHLAGSFDMKWITKEMFYPHKPILFEGHYFPGPGNVDAFLSFKYGDYMKLPPVEKRDQHQADYDIWD